MSAPVPERRLLAILAADVVEYSRMMEADEAGTIARLKAMRADHFDPLIAVHHGRLVKLMGDGALVAFDSVVDAVGCAADIQQALAAHSANLPEADRIVLRIGVNLGDVVVVDDDVYGDGVNIAARLEQLCEPGSVMVSGTAYDHLQGKITSPLDFVGEQHVKNIARPVRVYRLKPEGGPSRLRLFKALRRKTRPIAIVAISILVLAGAGLWWLRPSAPISLRPSIAVLPFASYGGDEATDRLADGLTEDIITDLSRQSMFDVIARSSTEVYKGKPTDVRQIGRDLNVRLVLEGSIQRQGDRIRTTAQLIDATTGAHVWSDRWDRPAGDVFAVQTEIAEQVIGQFEMLTGPIRNSELIAAKRKRPGNLTAYELNLLGVEKQLSPTRESIAESIGILTKAVEIDPAFAPAWTNLAWGHVSAIDYGGDWEASIQPAMQAAERAVELDPNDADAHSVLGHVFAMKGEFDRAKPEFETSLRLNPGSFSILIAYVGWASTFGEPNRGAELADRAIKVNPRYKPWACGSLRYAYFMAGRYEDALHVMARQTPDNYSRNAWVQRAASFAALGRAEEARTTLAEALKRYPDLTIESHVSDPGFNDAERQRLISTMKLARFPSCAKREQLSQFVKPVRLPECGALP
jgi:TolB-like protein/class 3 adenylate cyclase/tetratricopeptide (TPR) repeat protein